MVESWEESRVFARLWRPPDVLTPATQAAISHNAQVRVYPDGSAIFMAATRNLFRESGYEGRQQRSREKAGKSAGEGEGGSRALRRARARVRDIARATDFRYFVTLTLSAEHVDRYDIGAIVKKMRTWLDNNVRRRGLAYVLIPEHHKDGAVHFHGFFNDALEAVDSGTVRVPGHKRPRRPRSAAERERWLTAGGHIVYNLPGWPFGFSTAIELYGDRQRAVSYVLKYLSKEGAKIGGRYYYSGGALGSPLVVCADIDFDAVAREGHRFELPEVGAEAAMIDFEKGADFLDFLQRYDTLAHG